MAPTPCTLGQNDFECKVQDREVVFMVQIASWAKGLEGQSALITGGSKGLGAATAVALAKAGAAVTVVARDPAGLNAFTAEHPELESWVADVGSDDFAETLEARDFDILVNNAGTNHPLPMVEVDDATLDSMLNLNVRAVYRASRAVVRGMIRRGSGGAIINITSQMGHVGSPRRTVYCMTKHALEGLTKAMAVELAPHGIRVNSVAPTFIETPLTAPMLADPEFAGFVQRMIPLGRIGKAEDVAAAVLYLASPAAAMVTGTSLLVDGGWTAQ
jgi:NAD(P)-dependent dehydrogenase (short-subunit alcohol dehydrogenase family)